jgi:hypothetical protein
MFASLDTDGYLDSGCTLIKLAGSDTHAESLSWDDLYHTLEKSITTIVLL